MKFVISKTTGTDDDMPCENAFKITIPYWDVRTCSENHFNDKIPNNNRKWRDDGSDHFATSKGCIARRLKDREEWAVEINSLEELMSFIDKYGKIIIMNTFGQKPDFPAEIREIEIYNDYRE